MTSGLLVSLPRLIGLYSIDIAIVAGMSSANINSIKSGTVLNKKWRLTSKVGEGAFGWVYNVELADKGSSVCTYNTQNVVEYDLVVKIISTGQFMKKKDQKDQIKNCNTLNYEYEMIVGHLADFPSRPRVPEKFYDTDSSLGVRYLVMEKMDHDLQSYAISNHPLQSGQIAELASFGQQILQGLQWFHERNLLFIDVKPQNFMIKGDSVYFIDFGLVEIPNNKRNPSRGLVGTPTFASVATHCDSLLNFPRDDVEAMAYSLLSTCSKGLLPWSSASSDAQCIKMKKDCDIISFAASCGMRELGEIVLHCRGLDASAKPNYDFCKQKLLQMQSSKGKGGSSNSSKITTSVKVRGERKRRAVAVVDSVDDDEEDQSCVPMEIEEDVIATLRRAPASSKGRKTVDIDVAVIKSASRKRK